MAQERELLWTACPLTILACTLHELAHSTGVIVEVGRDVIYFAVKYRPRVILPLVLGHFGQRYPLVWEFEAGLYRRVVEKWMASGQIAAG